MKLPKKNLNVKFGGKDDVWSHFSPSWPTNSGRLTSASKLARPSWKGLSGLSYRAYRSFFLSFFSFFFFTFLGRETLFETHVYIPIMPGSIIPRPFPAWNSDFSASIDDSLSRAKEGTFIFTNSPGGEGMRFPQQLDNFVIPRSPWKVKWFSPLKIFFPPIDRGKLESLRVFVQRAKFVRD